MQSFKSLISAHKLEGVELENAKKYFSLSTRLDLNVYIDGKQMYFEKKYFDNIIYKHNVNLEVTPHAFYIPMEFLYINEVKVDFPIYWIKFQSGEYYTEKIKDFNHFFAVISKYGNKFEKCHSNYYTYVQELLSDNSLFVKIRYEYRDLFISNGKLLPKGVLVDSNYKIIPYDAIDEAPLLRLLENNYNIGSPSIWGNLEKLTPGMIEQKYEKEIKNLGECSSNGKFCKRGCVHDCYISSAQNIKEYYKQVLLNLLKTYHQLFPE